MSVRKEMRVAPLVIALALAGCGGGASVGSAPETGAANPTTNASGGSDGEPAAGTGGGTDGGSGGAVTGTDTGGGGSDGDMGGGGTTGTTGVGGDDGGATGGSTDGAGASTGSALSGRVADGYIRGATVCVDLNENEVCDADEPSAISGEGGVYELVVPAGAEGKPIVAEIPPEAIDEDSGEAVGETLVFSAPGARPDFVSPITTLVQEELRDNPALGVDEAERVMRGELGLDEDGDVSLFEDYVAAGVDDGDAERAKRFGYLHETARVATRLMGDIRARIEAGANEEGIDLAGDADGRRAVEGIVREELRRLLPDIAREVAVRVDADDAIEGNRELAEFERERIAGELYPEERLESIDERLRSEREADTAAADAPAADMAELLAVGLHWLEVDCHPHAEPAPSALADSTGLAGDGADVATGGVPAEICEARSGQIALDDEGTGLVMTHRDHDGESGVWVEQEAPPPSRRLALIDGEWVVTPDIGPVGPVSFGADGEALIETGLGEWRIRGLAVDLGGRAVAGRLWHDPALAPLATVVVASDLFDGEATLYPLVVEEPLPEFVLPDLGRDETCPSVDACDAVVDLADSFGPGLLPSLQWLRERAVEGIDLGGVARERETGWPIVVSLSGKPAADGTLPVAGEARWRFVAPYLPEGLEREEPSSGGEPLPPPDGEEPLFLPEIEGEEMPLPGGEEPFLLHGSEDGGALFDPTELEVVVEEGEEPFEFVEVNDRYVAEAETLSKWRLIEADGVAMVELDLPLAARHRLGLEGAVALVLVERDGLLRSGIRFAGARVREHLAYDAAAFATLRDLAERFLAAP